MAADSTWLVPVKGFTRKAWCSNCYAYSSHECIEARKMGRDQFRCRSCRCTTQACISGCSAMSTVAIPICAYCSGKIRTWENAQVDDETLLTARHVDPRPPWQQDSSVSQCLKCERSFSIAFGRHHCRSCGRIFCNECSRRRASLPNFGYQQPVRVCDFCFPITELKSQS